MTPADSPTASRNCQIYVSITSTTLNPSGCVEVMSSVFFNQTSMMGGAIYLDSGFALWVMDCAFVQCEADFGGGIVASGSAPDVRRCCFRETKATFYGLAIVTIDSRRIELRLCSFVDCENPDSAYANTVSITDDFESRIVAELLNCSACVVPSGATGAAFDVSSDVDSQSSFSLLTIANSSGLSIVNCRTTWPAEVDQSNFYDNAVSESVIYCEIAAMAITNCVFSGNSKDIGKSGVTFRGFDVIGCVFSGNLPASEICRLTRANLANTTTASIALDQFRTDYCLLNARSSSPVAASPPFTHPRETTVSLPLTPSPSEGLTTSEEEISVAQSDQPPTQSRSRPIQTRTRTTSDTLTPTRAATTIGVLLSSAKTGQGGAVVGIVIVVVVVIGLVAAALLVKRRGAWSASYSERECEATLLDNEPTFTTGDPTLDGTGYLEMENPLTQIGSPEAFTYDVNEAECLPFT
jgi:hypothetical protein